MGWAKIKKCQADDAERLAAVAAGIGECGIANALYRLEGILRHQALEITQQEARKRMEPKL